MSESIKIIKEKLLKIEDPANEYLESLKTDQRKGVQNLLTQWQRRYDKYCVQQQRFIKMHKYEQAAYENGYQWIAGIDEVGRGPLAGPVVACAVILPKNFVAIDLNDSKQLTLKQREELYLEIKSEAIAIGIGLKSEKVIDEINIYQATKLAMLDAVNNLSITPDHLLIDAMMLDTSITQEKIIKGDTKSVSIAAASVVAKVTRDHLMADYAKKYLGYGFEHNAGYGTSEHLAGINQLGITPIHRKTFAPIKNYI